MLSCFKKITENGENLTKEYYLRSSTGTDLATLDMTKNKLTWYVHGASRIAHFEHTRKLPEGWVSDLSGTKADSTKPKMGPTPAFVAPPMIFYNYDHLGNTRLPYSASVKLGDEKATITYTCETIHDYDPYGKILRSFSRTAAGEKYLTTGHERDTETDLDYRGARFYDSEVVRFLSLDPLAAKFPSQNAYMYVSGQPVNRVDKDGKTDGDVTVAVTRAKGSMIEHRTISIKATYYILNISDKTVSEGQFGSGGKTHMEKSFTTTRKEGKNTVTVNCDVTIDVQYKMADKLSDIPQKANVMILTNNVKGGGEDGRTLAWGQNNGQAIIMASSQLGDKQTQKHELGHNLGFTFPSNPKDPQHSPEVGNIMYHTTGGASQGSGEYIRAFQYLINGNAGNYKLDGSEDAIGAAKQIFNSQNESCNDAKRSKCGL